jgi:hypothetical protein
MKVLKDKFDNYLAVSFVITVFYQFMTNVFPLDGVSLFKILIGLLPYISIAFFSFAFYNRISKLKDFIPKLSFTIFGLLLITNALAILRSIIDGEGSFVTLFGNTFTAMPLFLPLTIIFGLTERSLPTFFKVSKFLLTIAIFAIPLVLLIDVENWIIALFYVLSISWFFIPTMISFGKRTRFIVILASLFTLIISYYYMDSRSNVIRVILLYSTLIPILIYKNFGTKLYLKLSLLLLTIISAYFINSMIKGESFFEPMLEFVSDEELKTDTRTFLYSELITDLKENKALLIGKGANSTYYSEYFHITKEDTDNRLTAEVGVLAIMLKGGIIALFLNLFLFFNAVILAFFYSKNNFVKGVGFFLLIHILLLFIENLIRFSIYNYLIWIMVGICLSKRLRGYNDKFDFYKRYIISNKF